MKSYLIDIPITLIFFIRDDTLRKVFEKVRESRPSKLFLVQDGPRENDSFDIDKIAKCREIVEDIDWECEVYRNYSDVNLGCGYRVATGISWVFEHVDRSIILEDDCVIEPSFVPFSAELLEKYKNDTRVSMISALNHFEKWDTFGNDYFFSHVGAIAAWATWKRSWDGFDYLISDFKDEYVQTMLPLTYPNKRIAKNMMKLWENIYEKGKKNIDVNLWDLQFSYQKQKGGGLCIVPSYSMSSNIGVGQGSTFSGMGIMFMKKSVRQWFYQDTKPKKFPLKHPQAVISDLRYDNRYYNIAHPYLIVDIFTRLFYKIKRKLIK